MNKYILSLICISIAFASSAKIYTVKDVPNVQLEDATRFVSNPDEIISKNAENIINSEIAVVRDSASAEIAVVLLESIGDRDIDDFATDLFMDWKIGKKDNDNGLLFLLVKDQRQMVFRTGYGLEGVLPDAILGRVIRNDISPYLKQGDFDGGITNGIEKVCEYLLNPEAIQEIYSSENSKPGIHFEESSVFGYLFVGFVICFLFVIWTISVLGTNKNNYEKYMSFKKGKGLTIFFTVFFPISMLLFCIIYFFLKGRLRNKPIKCPKCKTKMQKLSQTEEVPYLNRPQLTEEKIGSIDYDVWKCDNCNYLEILPYKKRSKYTPCPFCNAVTYYLASDIVISRATTLSSGAGEQTFSCKNCGKSYKRRYKIPRIVVTSSSDHGGSSWGSGSGNSGGSWGGGSTGGGGARGGW